MGRSLTHVLLGLCAVCDSSLAAEQRAAPLCRTCNASAGPWSPAVPSVADGLATSEAGVNAQEYAACVTVVKKTEKERAEFLARQANGEETMAAQEKRGRRPNATVRRERISRPMNALRLRARPMNALRLRARPLGDQVSHECPLPLAVSACPTNALLSHALHMRVPRQFEFHEEHELFGQYHQKLNSKVACIIHVGKPPPNEPKQLGPGQAVSAPWLQKRAQFAGFMVANFVPWEHGATKDECIPADLSPESLAGWIAHLEEQATGSESSGMERTIARGRLHAIRQWANGLRVSDQLKQVHVQYRLRNRTISRAAMPHGCHDHGAAPRCG